jgi:ABC-type multidrug transport system ATPase subunit
MHVLRLRDASYSVSGRTIVAPVTLDVDAGERVAHVCSSAQEAHVLAMIGAALARATSGIVLIGEFDPRVQPVHCKRLAAFVPHDPLPLAEMNVEQFIEYRAALWNIGLEQARAHARIILERLEGLHEAFAYPIVASLLAFPSLLVLDRPQPLFAKQILSAAGPCAVFSTHVDAAAAAEFSAKREEALA